MPRNPRAVLSWVLSSRLRRGRQHPSDARHSVTLSSGAGFRPGVTLLALGDSGTHDADALHVASREAGSQARRDLRADAKRRDHDSSWWFLASRNASTAVTPRDLIALRDSAGR